jgi:hypothetical protein
MIASSSLGGRHDERIKKKLLGLNFFGSSVPSRDASKDKTICNGTTAETTGAMNTPCHLSSCI